MLTVSTKIRSRYGGLCVCVIHNAAHRPNRYGFCQGRRSWRLKKSHPEQQKETNMNFRTTKLAVAVLVGLGTLSAAIEAHAQSVEIYGVIGAYAGSFKRSGDNAAVQQ